MSLKDIMQSQLMYQVSLGRREFKTIEDRMNYIRDTCVALNVEVAEFLQELPWKPWRDTEDQHLDYDKAADELADVFIFALNLWITLGQYAEGKAAAELARRITSKQSINMDRLLQNYNTIINGDD